jgi:hypothetical protein
MSNNSAFVVLLVGTFSGVAAFSFSHALSAWRRRHQSVTNPLPTTSPLNVLGRAGLFTGVLFLISMTGYRIIPHEVARYKGLMDGEGLFSVYSIPGYAAAFPSSSPTVSAGQPLVLFYRNPSAEEAEKAMKERAVLEQKIQSEQMREPSIDPFILFQYESVSRRLDLLADRERQLVRQRDLSIFGEKGDLLSLQDNYSRVTSEIISARYDLEQETTALRNAETEKESATAVENKGVLSKSERRRIMERYDQQKSRRNQKADRVRQLESEAETLNSRIKADKREPNHSISTTDDWLRQLIAEKEILLKELEEVKGKLEHEQSRATERRQAFINQLQIEINEADKLLNAFALGYLSSTPTKVPAPWDGIVGFRSPSPSNSTPMREPIITIYRPGGIMARMVLPKIEEKPLEDDLRILILDSGAPSGEIQFEGRIQERIEVPDDNVTLLIACNPPPRLMRLLATGQTAVLDIRFESQAISFHQLAKMARKLISKITDRPIALTHEVVIVAILLFGLSIRVFRRWLRGHPA